MMAYLRGRKRVSAIFVLLLWVSIACGGDTGAAQTYVPLKEPLAHTDGVLRVAVVGGAPHGDLHQLVSEWATLFGPGPSYSRLLRFDVGHDVNLPSMRVVCDLCVDWAIRDSLTYEFDLHPDARWQPVNDFASRQVMAGDVVASLERLRSVGFPHSGLLGAVDEIIAVDADTVRLELLVPDADLPQKLASPYAVIFPADLIETSATRIDGASGSGPWRYHKGMSGQVDLTRWEGYFRADESTVDRIVFLPVSSLNLGSSLLRAGEVDIAQVTEEQWQTLKEQGFNSEIVRRQGTGIVFGVNSTKDPLDDRDVRRAIWFSIRPNDVIKEIWGGPIRFGLGVPVVDTTWQLSQGEVDQFFDNSKASSDLLSSVQVTDLPLTLIVANFGPSYVAVGELFAEQLTAAGFDVTVDIVTRSQYLTQVWDDRDFDLFLGPLPPTSHTNDFLLSLFHSDGNWNVTGSSDSHLDEILELQAQEYSSDRRGDIVRSIEWHVLNEALMFMPAVRYERWAYSDRVDSFHPSMSSGAGDFWRFVQLR